MEGPSDFTIKTVAAPFLRAFCDSVDPHRDLSLAAHMNCKVVVFLSKVKYIHITELKSYCV